ncbi:MULTISPECIES: VOC family protein [unclassified Enterobacter]|uniref:2-oxoadipate dioxygenase/decarboxylase HglS n=1 Tax=unclassified Enterobacter TaxID=2608935 RepID=UPI0015C74435|nr:MULTISPECIES: VOC family protein [unclassified Enterobacter]MBB3303582.1 putative glyoxalase superfamily metalloenzyme YdcJ [Enterobacter sp. Sphag1F]NYI13313.1 putative glyoxalase superfamily metalloenzyme YdcJ [Enterobacter sp. Sphag71]
MPNFLSSDAIRTLFSQAMSTMYQQEVPQYGTLTQLVTAVNERTLEANPELKNRLSAADELSRLSVERHGAIRVGKAEELSTLRQMFAVMGMEAVGYYDLSQAGVPVHSTAFRPVSDRALRHNPFRVFTSLLRLELIDDAALREKAAAILAARDIFTPGCRALIAKHQQQGGLNAADAATFVQEALETFRWHAHTTVDSATYRALSQQHRLIADVVCFRGCHINHLTPRTLDIDRVQSLMPSRGIDPKTLIEGPPQRKVPILLRQTSFKALEEAVHFNDGTPGTHTARFGEIEQRGAALTPKGRELYDRLLAEAGTGSDNQHHQQHLSAVFSDFPDDEESLREQQLAWFRYRLTDKGEHLPPRAGESVTQLLAEGRLSAEPIVYEDFLPVSAAGIFQSNLGDVAQTRSAGNASRADFETALGTAVQDEMALYQQMQQRSLERCSVA